MSIELVMPSNHLILCCPLFLTPSTFHSIRVFSNELALCIRWPKHWRFSFSISLSKEYSVWISFRINWLISLLSRSFLQHHSLKHQFFGSQPSYGPTLTSVHDYWKNHSFDNTELCWQSDVSAVLVCHSFPSKEQASFNFMAAVTICSDLGAQENKIFHCFHFSSSICMK